MEHKLKQMEVREVHLQFFSFFLASHLILPPPPQKKKNKKTKKTPVLVSYM